MTGAASGLGFETAAALARRGASVILADRNVSGGEAAARSIQAHAGSVEFRALDLADLAAIRAFASALEREGRALDLLINVAGILPPLQRAITRDGFELKFGINYLGHFALTGLLLPALQRSPTPRVVSVSSIVARYARIDFADLQAERSYDPQRAYRQAKLACLVFALELHRRAQNAGMRLTSVAAHPGIARTAIARSRDGQRRATLRDHAEDVALAIAMKVFGQSADRGAMPLIRAATAPDVRGGDFYGPSGFGQFAGNPVRVEPAAVALDAETGTRLWLASEELTGVRYLS